ncbi:hypothetical protein BVRB_008700 [Beta vulgaris subsp. vulgaris]|uniref:Uncharacterized protein n=1 Tax=Beta vulgaris subsp. vulgaris TaxID=3555 RepID=A0A0J8B318_BETVV|nr:hypothetical protein BVRB_008700 [Beta vulgaris subsp. vulgaris]
MYFHGFHGSGKKAGNEDYQRQKQVVDLVKNSEASKNIW